MSYVLGMTLACAGSFIGGCVVAWIAHKKYGK